MSDAVVTFRRVEHVEREPFGEYQYTFEVGGLEAQAVVTVWEKTKGGPLHMDRARKRMRQLAVDLIDAIDREDAEAGRS